MRERMNFLKKATLWFCVVFVGFSSTGQAQSSSATMGKTFYVTFFDNGMPPFPAEQQLKIVVERACYIRVRYNINNSHWQTTTSGSTIVWDSTVLIQPGIYTDTVISANVVNQPAGNSGQATSKCMTISSNANICVYSVNSGAASTDGTCILPVSAWGNKYMLMTGIPGTNNCYAVISKENGTSVRLHNGQNITLNQNQVYHFTAPLNVSMTGDTISATKPVAVFSGAMFGNGFGSCYIGQSSADHYYEQLWSMEKWGRDFFAFPIQTPNGIANWGGELAILARDNGTRVTVSGGINGGPHTYNLNSGTLQKVCFAMSGLTRIVADKPIAVFQSLPDITLITIQPTSQRITHAIVAPFILSGTSTIYNHGIDMLIPSAFWNRTVIKENGVTVSNSTYTANSSQHFRDWYHIRKNLPNTNVAITIDCPSGFLAYISGNGGNESYGFSAGVAGRNLMAYFTIEEQQTALPAHYENTNVLTHTFLKTDTVVVERAIFEPFTLVRWLLNGVSYPVAENSNNVFQFKIPASQLQEGENRITMAVRFQGAAADSLYTGSVWLPEEVSVCDGDSISFASDITPAGMSAAYQWFVNGSPYPVRSTDSIFTYFPRNGDTVRCRVIPDLNCLGDEDDTLYSSTVIITVIPRPAVSATIISDTNNVCSGTLITFTVSSTNGGTPTYQWNVNGVDILGATNTTYTYTPANGDTIVCKVTSTLICAAPNPATSNTITMTINPKGTPTIIIRRRR